MHSQKDELKNIASTGSIITAKEEEERILFRREKLGTGDLIERGLYFLVHVAWLLISPMLNNKALQLPTDRPHMLVKKRQYTVCWGQST